MSNAERLKPGFAQGVFLLALGCIVAAGCILAASVSWQ
jgi:hypothetical protein